MNDLKIKIGIGVAFALSTAGVLAYRAVSSPGDANAKAGAQASSAASAASVAPAVEVTMLYGSEKKEWVEAAAEGFRKDHPEIKLTLVAKGSLEAAQGVLDGRERPTIFSPADSLVMNMLAADWKTKGRAPIVADSGDEAPTSLVMTPLVFVAWEDRAQALTSKGSGEIRWKTLHDATTSPKGWPAAGGKPEWGFVKLGHTDPTKSNSGLEALYTMTLEYWGKQTIDVADLLDPKYQAFVKQTERSVSSFEPSTGTFMTEMVRFGPSKYDVAVVYENLAIAQLESAQGRWGSLRVHYPHVTVWSDHPAAVLGGDWVTAEQRAAGHLWLTYLRSRPVQERALAYGFRPGDMTVPVRTADPANPFTRTAPYGVRVDVPAAAKTPDGAVVRNLIVMWSRTCAPQTGMR
jgi:extracellular solute-binding protein